MPARICLVPMLTAFAWAVNISALHAQTPNHPVVPGFDRFFAKAKEANAGAGHLLLVELNCIACHNVPAGKIGDDLKKQAPILDGVGGRVRPSYLRAFLHDPQSAKPGTTMPNLLAALPKEKRGESVEALVHFLASTGSFLDTQPAAKAIAKGKILFHQVGCAACHGPHGIDLKDAVTVLPLGDLAKKYSIVSLTNFLQDPHKTRPSGRMPSLNLNYGEAQDTAHFLLAAHAEVPPAEAFQVDSGMVTKGRAFFASMGCASCHNLKNGNANIVSTLKAPDLVELKASAGCIVGKPSTGKFPRYSLNAAQRAALTAGILAWSKISATSGLRLDARLNIDQTFTAFNCYACHQREGKGGVEASLNEFFVTTQKEMGDEARIPPHLSGVGGKLTSAYLKKVLAEGAADRPYMLTRMPKFGPANVGHLQAALEAADPVPAAPMPTFKVSDKTIKAQGRQMVGNKVFACIKCHNFREFKSGGVQGINMTIMTDRVRREWFTQYLMDPNKYRPGTRMPAVWPLGQSQLPKVLEGDTAQQIEAVWRYLADGPRAAVPYGLGKELMPLVAQETPLIYRNFIEGAGTRAIGVGYPEKINLAFDANDLRYALLWHKDFIDASRHWTNRGEGFQPPLGEGVLRLPSGPTIAHLASKEAPWPTKTLKEKGYQFRGYILDDKLRPTFQYTLGPLHFDDLMLPFSGEPQATAEAPHFQRILTICSENAPENLWYRAAADAQIKELGKGWYAIGKDLKIRLETPEPPVLRTSGSQMELLVPIRGKQTRIVQEMVW